MVYFNIISFIATAAAFIVFRNYRKSYIRTLWPEVRWSGFCYGFPLWMYDSYRKLSVHFGGSRYGAGHMKSQLDKLMPLCSMCEAEEKLYAGVAGTFLWAWLLVHILSVLFAFCVKPPSYFENGGLLRPPAGSEPYTAVLEMENDVTGKSTVDVTVSPKVYDSSQQKAAFEKAKAYIMAEALGENTDWARVEKPLNFIRAVPETGISVAWDVGDYNLIDDSGNIIKEDISEDGEETTVTAKLIYEDISEPFLIYVKIFPKTQTAGDRLLADVSEKLLEADCMNRGEERLILPESADGHRLLWSVETKDTEAVVTLAGSLTAILCALSKISGVKSKIKVRNKQLIEDYPDFVHKLILLNGAGMSLRLAVETMLGDAKSAGRDRRYVWQEVQAVLRAMAQGVSEVQAYELFGQRCAQLPYLKLSSLMVQSLKKGVGGIQKMMSDAADEAVMMKRETAIKAGEAVGTKLLMPMGLLLAVVLIILVVPAFITMNI